MQTTPPETTQSDVRRRALTGGLFLVAIAGVLLTIAGAFVADRATPSEIWGVYLPFAVAVLVLEFSLFAFVPAIWGDSVHTATPSALRICLITLGLVGLAASAGAALLAEGAWAWGALLPALVSCVPIYDGFHLHARLMKQREASPGVN